MTVEPADPLMIGKVSELLTADATFSMAIALTEINTSAVAQSTRLKAVIIRLVSWPNFSGSWWNSAIRKFLFDWRE